MKTWSKISWYLVNLRNLCIASVQIFFYCLIHPRKSGKLFFSFFSAINDFYQTSHGRLSSIEETEFFKSLRQENLFASCNAFNTESVVTRLGETQTLAALVKKFQPRKVFEIGTYNGFTTLHFAYNTPSDSIIYTLDLPPDYGLQSKNDGVKHSYDDLLVIQLSQKNIENRIFKKDTQGKKVVEVFGDSKIFDFKPYYGQMDLVFIDGNHSYDFVASDTEQAFKMLSPKGVIIWHDYDYIIHRDVFKYLNKLSNERKIYFIPGTRFAIYGTQLS